MTRLREWDCGTWNDFAGINRITVRERGDGLFDVIHVRYVRTVAGMQKSESPVGIAHSLAEAKERGYAIWKSLREW